MTHTIPGGPSLPCISNSSYSSSVLSSFTGYQPANLRRLLTAAQGAVAAVVLTDSLLKPLHRARLAPPPPPPYFILSGPDWYIQAWLSQVNTLIQKSLPTAIQGVCLMACGSVRWAVVLIKPYTLARLTGNLQMHVAHVKQAEARPPGHTVSQVKLKLACILVPPAWDSFQVPPGTYEIVAPGSTQNIH